MPLSTTVIIKTLYILMHSIRTKNVKPSLMILDFHCCKAEYCIVKLSITMKPVVLSVNMTSDAATLNAGALHCPQILD
jgi:hypothetical protein